MFDKIRLIYPVLLAFLFSGCSYSQLLIRHHWLERPQRFGDVSFEFNQRQFSQDSATPTHNRAQQFWRHKSQDKETPKSLYIGEFNSDKMATHIACDFKDRLEGQSSKEIQSYLWDCFLKDGAGYGPLYVDRPIVFIHGYTSNAIRFSDWTNELKRCLEADGENKYQLFAFGYPTGYNWEFAPSPQELSDLLANMIEDTVIGNGIDQFAGMIAEKLESLDYNLSYSDYTECLRIAEEIYRHQHVAIVCHSTGGIIAKHYLARHRGNPRVSHLVTINTPHYGANWAGTKGWIVKWKDLFNVIRSWGFGVFIRTHVPEQERQIYELVYATSWQIELDHVLSDFLDKRTNRRGRPVIVAIGSEKDRVSRCASSLWNSKFTDYQEIWLNLGHSGFYTKEHALNVTAKRVALALLSLNKQPRDENLRKGIGPFRDKDKELVVIRPEYDGWVCDVTGGADYYTWGDVVDRHQPVKDQSIREELWTIPGALIVANEIPTDDQRTPILKYFMDCSREAYFNINAGYACNGWERLNRIIPIRTIKYLKTLRPYFNFINGLHYHRDSPILGMGIDYFCMEFYGSAPARWKFEYKIDVRYHQSALIGEDYVLSSFHDTLINRNNLWGLLIPDALVHLPDHIPGMRVPLFNRENEKPIVVVGPGRTTVLDLRRKQFEKAREAVAFSPNTPHGINGNFYLTPRIRPARETSRLSSQLWIKGEAEE
jgi:pimeloyl-ACP methyl ester carboxylesterase